MKYARWYWLSAIVLGTLVVFVALIVGGRTMTGFQMGDHGAHSGDDGMRTNEGMMDHGAMGHAPNVNLVASTEPEKALPIPKRLKPDKVTDDTVYYTIRAMSGETTFFAGGQATQTLGYNGDLLGPMVELPKGKNVEIKTINNLDEATSFHWHGLIVPGEVDGGPHQLIEPGETRIVRLNIEQDPATLWFHPHPLGATARQVYEGLAGLLYITDEQNSLPIPSTYGVDDIPLIVQDRTFGSDGELNYDAVRHADGTLGDTLLANGAINTVFNVTTESLRVRVVNGSQARNLTFTLDHGEAFTQIAGDGGMLEKPVALTRLTLSPGERAELILDFSEEKTGDNVKLLADGIAVNTFAVNERVANAWNPDSVSAGTAAVGSGIDRRLTLFGMGEMVTIDGKQYDHDRIDIEVNQGESEVWEIYNEKDMMGGMTHPFHMHGVQFRVVNRDGAPPPENERGWKDTIAVAPGERVRIALTFTETGTFMYHCHILEHEENGMMGQIRVNP